MKNFQQYLEMANQFNEGPFKGSTYKQEKITVPNAPDTTAYKFSFNLKYNNKEYKFEMNMYHDFWPDTQQVVGALEKSKGYKSLKNAAEREEIEEWFYDDDNHWEDIFKPIGQIFTPKHL